MDALEGLIAVITWAIEHVASFLEAIAIGWDAPAAQRREDQLGSRDTDSRDL